MAEFVEKAFMETSNNSSSQWVSFYLDDEIYAVNVIQVKEVLKYTSITRVPGAPDYVIGILNIRGTVLTVIDTRARFALARQDPSEHSRIIVVESDDQTIGILVDSVQEVFNLAPDEISAAPKFANDVRNRFVYGVSFKNDSFFILINLDELLTTKEWNDINQIS